MKTFRTSGTGSGQTLSEIESGVIPCYDNEADADADLSNLEDEQIFGVEETSGNTEGYQYPVNVVESGNMHSVTSNAVAGALSYSTNEIATGGKWIDGKPIYRKVIDIGNMPNTTQKDVVHNISNIGTVIELKGMFTGNNAYFPIPFVDNGSVRVRLQCSQTHVIIIDYTDLSSFTAFAILEYTKTTD